VFISIVITIRNEAANIQKVLESLIVQEPPFEIILVDAESTDGTPDIIKQYAIDHSEIKLFIHKGSRGESRNFGVQQASGEVVAFTDGGCTADNQWLKSIRQSIFKGVDIVAGKTVDVGVFRDIQRVKIMINEYDITWPSCNLAYKKQVFEGINGYDTEFITAEDIDLNFRAVEQGATIVYNENAIIYRESAQNLTGLMRQSFWYGYGRKQLTLKHGKLWKKYSTQQMMQSQLNFQGLLRNFFGLLGYLVCKINNPSKN
jgi:glycosyltransferase involved in cell wall biosynthesis